MSKRILVVEDQPDTRRIIRDMLAPTDYEVTEAENGEEALAAIAKQHPDLILIDVVPDAMRIAAAIGGRTDAFGAHWCLPGGGPLSGRQAAEIAGRHLGRPIKLRSAGMTMLRIVSLFNKELRGFLQVAPDYMNPVTYDTRKLQGLLWPQHMTSYDVGIGQTLTWVASGR
jgi:hypothetical protein